MGETQSNLNYCWQPMGDPIYDGDDRQVMGTEIMQNAIRHPLQYVHPIM